MAPPPKSVQVERLFRTLADRTRLRLLNLMSGQEICVCHLADALGASQPKISRHLAYLRRGGLVASRRDGKWMHYRIAVPHDTAIARILREVQGGLAHDPVLERDRQRLVKACCPPAQRTRGKGGVPPAPASVADSVAVIASS